MSLTQKATESIKLIPQGFNEIGVNLAWVANQAERGEKIDFDRLEKVIIQAKKFEKGPIFNVPGLSVISKCFRALRVKLIMIKTSLKDGTNTEKCIVGLREESEAFFDLSNKIIDIITNPGAFLKR